MLCQECGDPDQEILSLEKEGRSLQEIADY